MTLDPLELLVMVIEPLGVEMLSMVLPMRIQFQPQSISTPGSAGVYVWMYVRVYIQPGGCVQPAKMRRGEPAEVAGVSVRIYFLGRLHPR